jgi:hypothetical protein
MRDTITNGSDILPKVGGARRSMEADRLTSPPCSDNSSPSRRREQSTDSRPCTPSVPEPTGAAFDEDYYAGISPLAIKMSEQETTEEKAPSQQTTTDEDLIEYSASITSEVQSHVFEDGFRYHAYRDGKYAFPNDDIEQNRDDLKHAVIMQRMQGRYHYAPVDQVLEAGGEVLDLGKFFQLNALTLSLDTAVRSIWRPKKR